MQNLYQQLGIEWLRQEGQCPGRKRSFANVHFIVRGDKDDGEAVAAFKPFLHIKTVEARHLHVEDDALEPFKRQGFDMVNELLAEAKVVASIPNERTSRFIELRKASSSSQ